MIIELRKKSQITIPQAIMSASNLKEGDHLDIGVRDGVIVMEPVAIYSKDYVKRLENTVMMIDKKDDAHIGRGASSAEDAMKYLESDDENTD